ncbi:ABC transporter ATP-binding protein [bacterium]|nr:MAG: ABC transporter ATP-binding protein [bacterium]
MFMKNKDKKIKEVSLGHLVKAYAWPLRKIIFVLIFVTLLGNFLSAARPIVLAGIMNIMIEQKQLDTSPAKPSGKFLDLNNIGHKVLDVISGYSHSKWDSLLILAGIFILLEIISAFFQYGGFLLASYIETQALKLIQTDIIKHLLSLNMSFFNHQKTGDLMSRIMQDAKSTANGIGPTIRGLFYHTILIILYSSYLLSTNVLLTVVAVVLILFQFGLTEIIKRPTRSTIRKMLDKTSDLSNMLHETFTSMRVIKSFGCENYELGKLQKGINASVKAEIKTNVVKHVQEPTRSILDAFAMIGIILIAAQQVLIGNLTIQGFALFIFVGGLLVQPINGLAVTVSWWQSLLASYTRIYQIFQNKPQVVDGKLVKNNFSKNIKIDGVSFSYGNANVLDNISFEVKKGEIVAIVGPSGAGKSTLVDLILRLYDPTGGVIYIDGMRLGELSHVEYRRIFGVVPQQNILFNDTVKNNILYGRFDLTDDDVIRAAKIANADEFIMQLPDGYNTLVGERGVLLSGGQCQRIAIARAVVAKPQILIFDEATSSLDTDSEKQVQTAIDRVLEGSTAIAIAHRLSTILHADKIVVLSQGKIEAIGKHQELLKISPTYLRLYNLQFEMGKMQPEKQDD